MVMRGGVQQVTTVMATLATPNVHPRETPHHQNVTKMITTFRTTSHSLAATSKAILISTFRFPLHRQYHSYQHPPPPSPFTPAESKILSAALQHVPSHGFSTTTLSLGARDVGYLDISVNLLPRGVFDLVNYHLVTERLRLSQEVDFSELENGTKKLSVPARIRTLCVERLRANSPIIHRWQEVHFISPYT